MVDATITLDLFVNFHIKCIINVDQITFRHRQNNISFINFESLRLDIAEILLKPHFELCLLYLLAIFIETFVLNLVLLQIMGAIRLLSNKQHYKVFQDVVNFTLITLKTYDIVFYVNLM